MEALFTNPLTLLAGGLLVSSPILIHLINRMRFRRIKWAAMEFLLKAQKRMRRKLIIEQLILLMLRCLLVFLIGLLLARFKWFSPIEGQETRATAHIVILDDTPSMGDAFAADGKNATAFEQAKAQITERIAPAAAQANTPQSMDLVLLSDLANPRPYDRLNETAVSDMKDFLGAIREPSPVRVSLVDGLRRAKQILDTKPDSDVSKVIHLVTDLRSIDWIEDGETIKQLTTELAANGVSVHLIDVAYPNRKDTDRMPRSSDNVGIVEFRPMAKTAARFQPVEFEIRVKNFGATELKDVRIRFFLNGKGNVITDRTIPNLPPNQEQREVVQVQFDRVGTAQNPLDRFNIVTADLAIAEPGGLAIDNYRHAVVEVQDRLSILAVEGRESLRDDPKGDGFYLKRLFQDAFGGINWVDGKVSDLEKQDLRQYAAVYLLNVPSVKEDAAKKLEAYVRGGGGLGIFLGPDVKPEDYNKFLYNEANGVFPVPLPSKETEPAKSEYTLVLSKQVLLRDPSAKTHPALAGLYTNERGGAIKDNEIEKFFNFPTISQYWKIDRFGKWLQDRGTQELYCLPNKKPVTDLEGPTHTLIAELKVKAAEPKFEKPRQYLDPLQDKIKRTAAGQDPDVIGASDKQPPMAKLAVYLDRLLCDQINDGDESEPVLREFWSQPELAALKAKFQSLRDQAKFGDPLYIVKQFGQGRVAAFTTTAGDQWTNWPSTAGVPGWVAVVSEMQRYLSGGGNDANRSVGSAVTATLEAAKYKPVMSRTVMTVDAGQGEKAADIPVKVDVAGEQPLEAKGGNLEFRYNEAKKPGVYVFTFTQLTGANGEIEKPEYVAYTFNVDTIREGDLRRANRDDIAVQAPNVPVHSPDDTTWVNVLKQKRDDLSTRRWIYLVILLVLLAEQAMAVRLSYHTRAGDLDLHAPSAAAVFHHGTTPMPGLEAAAEPVETV